MAVTSTAVRSGPYVVNGITTVFPFSFNAASIDEIRVYTENDDGQTAITAGFNTTLNSDNSGQITFDTAPAITSDSLYIESDPSFEQSAEFENQGAFLANVHEESFDRAAMRDLKLRDMINRLVVGQGLPVSDIWPNLFLEATYDGLRDLIGAPSKDLEDATSHDYRVSNPAYVRFIDEIVGDHPTSFSFIPNTEHDDIKNGSSTYNCGPGLMSGLNLAKHVILREFRHPVDVGTVPLSIPDRTSLVGMSMTKSIIGLMNQRNGAIALGASDGSNNLVDTYIWNMSIQGMTAQTGGKAAILAKNTHGGGVGNIRMLGGVDIGLVINGGPEQYQFILGDVWQDSGSTMIGFGLDGTQPQGISAQGATLSAAGLTDAAFRFRTVSAVYGGVWDVLACKHGFKTEGQVGDAGNNHIWMHIALADSCVEEGYYLSGPNESVFGMRVDLMWCGSNGLTNGKDGMLINDAVKAADFTIVSENNGGHGAQIQTNSSGRVGTGRMRGIAHNNGNFAPGTKSGVLVTGGGWDIDIDAGNIVPGLPSVQAVGLQQAAPAAHKFDFRVRGILNTVIDFSNSSSGSTDMTFEGLVR